MADAAATTDSPKNEVKIEDVGPALKRLSITIPASLIDEKLEDSMQTLATQTSLPGFRKGRVPRALLERRFGSAVMTETRNQILAEAYTSALEENGIKPVGDPKPGEDTEELEITRGKPLTFTIEVEVAPEFEIPDLENIDIKRPVIEISDEHIEEEYERHQMQLGAVETIDGDFQENDRLLGQAVVMKDGDDEPFFDSSEVVVVVPAKGDERGHILGVLVEDLADEFVGKKVGETLEITTTGPENHEREDLRNAKLTISYQITAAERITPARCCAR